MTFYIADKSSIISPGIQFNCPILIAFPLTVDLNLLSYCLNLFLFYVVFQIFKNSYHLADLLSLSFFNISLFILHSKPSIISVTRIPLVHLVSPFSANLVKVIVNGHRILQLQLIQCQISYLGIIATYMTLCPQI